jgi:hypothetical protein
MEILKDWFITFGKILVRPSPNTFREEAEKANGKLISSILWVVFSVIFTHSFNYIVHGTYQDAFMIVATILFVPIAFLFMVFCIHFLYQRLFHRKKDHYDEILYLAVAIFVPFGILPEFISLIPALNVSWLTFVFIIYQVLLLIIAVKAITNLRVWQASVVVVLGVIVGAAGFICIPAFLINFMYEMPELM